MDEKQALAFLELRAKAFGDRPERARFCRIPKRCSMRGCEAAIEHICTIPAIGGEFSLITLCDEHVGFMQLACGAYAEQLADRTAGALSLAELRELGVVDES